MKEFTKMLLTALVLSLLIINFVVQGFYIPSTSMSPTLEAGDRILVNKFIYRFYKPDYKDIIVFRYPEDRSINFVKRVIGRPGDKLAIKDGVVYLNQEPLAEEYKAEAGYSNFSEVKVPKDHYFVLGDNRNNSEDSRYWGFVPEEDILGKTFLIFWPLTRFSVLSSKASAY